MTAQLLLPKWLVEKLDDSARAYAEEMTLRQGSVNASVHQVSFQNTVRWIEHESLWEVRAE